MNWKDEIIANAKRYKYGNADNYFTFKYYKPIEDVVLPSSSTTPVSTSFITCLGGEIEIKFEAVQFNYKLGLPITATISDADGGILYEQTELVEQNYIKIWSTIINVKPFQKINISINKAANTPELKVSSYFTLYITDSGEYIKMVD